MGFSNGYSLQKVEKDGFTLTADKHCHLQNKRLTTNLQKKQIKQL